MLGQLFYGNASGLAQNYVGNRLLSNARKKVPQGEKFLDCKQKINGLLNNGFVFFDEKKNLKSLNSIQKKFDRWCIENAKKMSQCRLQVSSLDKDFDFYKNFPEIKALLNGDVSRILKGYYGSNFEVLNVHIYRTVMPKKDSILLDGGAFGSTMCWHTDGSTTDTIKVFYLLNDVTDEGGPMLFMNKRNSKIISGKHFPFIHTKHGKPDLENFDQHDGAYSGKKGLGLIVDTNKCLHRASIPNETTRDMICFYIGVNGNQTQNCFHNTLREPHSALSRLLN